MENYQIPRDGGMLYTETDLGQLFPEPLNAITSTFFLVIALYWTWRIWGQWKRQLFLAIALFLLYIGGIGGMIYHGLRLWPFFIMMDWLPIMLLCLSAGVYFLARLTRWYWAAGLVLLYVIFLYYARQEMKKDSDIQLFININYAVLASLVLFPVLGYLIKTQFAYGKWVGFALGAFILALCFRISDKWGLLESGTHFLWHTFGAVAAFCMLHFVFLVNDKIR